MAHSQAIPCRTQVYLTVGATHECRRRTAFQDRVHSLAKSHQTRLWPSGPGTVLPSDVEMDAGVGQSHVRQCLQRKERRVAIAPCPGESKGVQAPRSMRRSQGILTGTAIGRLAPHGHEEAELGTVTSPVAQGRAKCGKSQGRWPRQELAVFPALEPWAQRRPRDDRRSGIR